MTLKRILLLHGYSAANRGDGLLVEESLALIREVHGLDAEIDLVTSYPESFVHTGLTTFSSKPSLHGYSLQYLRLLAGRFRDYDLVVGVGGGYLRFGTPIESLKTLVVMGPQLIVAAYCQAKSVYLPQSIGPARFGFGRPLRALVNRLDQVWVRDNRSLEQFLGNGISRASDLALLAMNRSIVHFDDTRLPVVSVREHRGGVPASARSLARRLRRFDGYVQSAVAGNDDSAAVSSLDPENVCTYHELMVAPESARVVVAVRLHAALMAINAGHYVVHLAYERKGFGAFEDLGLENYVHNVHDFSVDDVEQKVRHLQLDAQARQEYDARIAEASRAIQQCRSRVLASLACQVSD